METTTSIKELDTVLQCDHIGPSNNSNEQDQNAEAVRWETYDLTVNVLIGVHVFYCFIVEPFWN